MQYAIGEPPPELLPTHAPDSSSGCLRVARSVGMLVLFSLVLLSVLCVATSCTIQEITLYKTVNLPSPKATPR